MLNNSGIEPEMREKLWAECGATATILSNLMVKRNDKSPHERCYGTRSPYERVLKIFGEMGLKMENSKNLSEKLRNRGNLCFFVGFAKDHALNAYRAFDIESKKVIITRDVKWLKMTYGDHFN